jgi:hypothetical protein
VHPDDWLTEEEFGTHQLHHYLMRNVYHYLGLVLQVRQLQIAERIKEYPWEQNNTEN